MPALFNIAANLALGGGVALATRRSPAVRSELTSWALLFLVGFEAAIFTPAATYLFRFYPQWSMLYWFDPQIFPSLESWIGALSFVAVILNFAAAIGGFCVTRLGLLSRQDWLVWAPFGAAGVTTLVLLVLFGERVVFLGDYDAFWQGGARLFLLTAGGWVGLLLYAGGGAFVWWVRQRFADHDPSLL